MININSIKYPEIPVIIFDTKYDFEEYLKSPPLEYNWMVYKSIEYFFINGYDTAIVFMGDVYDNKIPVTINKKDFTTHLNKILEYFIYKEEYEECKNINTLINYINETIQE